MKKQLLLTLLVFLATTGSIMAQETLAQKPNAHAKETYFKLKAALNLVGEQDAKVYLVFEDYYTTELKIKEEMRNAGNTDTERMKDNFQRIAGVRDAKLKGILTEDQLKKWVNEIEPGMRFPIKKEDIKQ